MWSGQVLATDHCSSSRGCREMTEFITTQWARRVKSFRFCIVQNSSGAKKKKKRTVSTFFHTCEVQTSTPCWIQRGVREESNLKYLDTQGDVSTVSSLLTDSCFVAMAAHFITKFNYPLLLCDEKSLKTPNLEYACVCALWIGRGTGIFSPLAGNRSSLMPASSTLSSPALWHCQTSNSILQGERLIVFIVLRWAMMDKEDENYHL